MTDLFGLDAHKQRRQVGKIGRLFYLLSVMFTPLAAQAGGIDGVRGAGADVTVVLDGPNGQLQCLTLSNLASEDPLSMQLTSASKTVEEDIKAVGFGHIVNLSQEKELYGRLKFTLDPADAILRINATEYRGSDLAEVLRVPAKRLEIAAYRDGYMSAGKRVIASPCRVTEVAFTLSKQEAPVVKAGIIKKKKKNIPEAQIGEFIKDCEDCPQMVVVPSGSFVMGTVGGGLSGDAPATQVEVTTPFAVATHEVTFDQWEACVADQACAPKQPDDAGWGRQSRPVINVSWEDAQQYVSWLSITTNRPYRLLSEAEWEYVARAGTTTPFWWGQEVGHKKANCMDCEDGTTAQSTVPVGSFKANAFGVFDTVGNVWEWTQDCYAPTAYTTFKNYPSAHTPAKSCARVLRGGAWDLISQGAVASFRFNASQKLRSNNIGLRVARDLKW